MNQGQKKDDLYNDIDFLNWRKRWETRLSKNNNSSKKSIELMKKNNPVVIARNHKVEEVLRAAEQNDFNPINKFLEILKKPYDEQKNISDYQLPSSSSEKYQTFCGT